MANFATMRRALLLGLGLASCLATPSLAPGTESEGFRLVVVLYPHNSDGSPGNYLVDQAIRATLADGSSDRVEIYNEYLDFSLPRDKLDQQLQRDYLRRKYAGRKVDLVIAALSPALNFALKQRDVFPGAPVVFCAVDSRESQLDQLPPDVVGVPVNFDLVKTLDLALRLHPKTECVAVITGSAPMDVAWEREARKSFQPFERQLRFTYLAGLRMEELLQKVADLPEHSIIYYIHVFQDGMGKTLVPARVLGRVAERANAPIYGHVDTYVGRGIVGGHAFSFGAEGRNAARIGLRVLSGESPESIGVQEVSENAFMFDGRQLARWHIDEALLPPGSIVSHRERSAWQLYKWQIVGVVVLCVLQAIMIAGLLIQMANRRRAESYFQNAVEAAPNGMLMVSRDGTIVLANRQIERLFGYQKSELVGQPIELLVPAAVRAQHTIHRRSYFASPEARPMAAGQELSGRCKDGRVVGVEIGLSPLRTTDGLLVLASVIDVSERRRTEDALRTSRHQLLQLSGSLIGAQENERRRIARELHDDFSQSLALLSVELDILRQKLPPSVAELEPRMEALSDQVRQLSSSIHELSHELHPLKLEQLGLVASISGLCNEISRGHGITVGFAAEGIPVTIAPDTALCLYRIVQESLRNIVKHSGAKEASVSLSGDTDEIRLRIVDEGVGFEVSLMDRNCGLGFISMRERLRLVGGELTVNARPSRGTDIDVRVPLHCSPGVVDHLQEQVRGV